MRQGARPSWWKLCKKTFPLVISWRSVVQPSPPDVDSEGNVSLICTHRQTAYVLEAALNVCWGAPTNRRRWKRLCRHAFLSNMKRKPPGPIQAVQNENVNCKWRQNKEPWRTLSVGLCLFNAETAIDTEWKGNHALCNCALSCVSTNTFIIHMSVTLTLCFHSGLFLETFLYFSSCSGNDPPPGVYTGACNPPPTAVWLNSKQNTATRHVIYGAICCCFQFGVLPPCGHRGK